MEKEAKAMTAVQIKQSIAASSGQNIWTVNDVLEDLANLAYQEAKNGFKIPGLGKIVLVNRKARTGRHPKTGETIEIPARKVVKFRVSKTCKEAVLGK